MQGLRLMYGVNANVSFYLTGIASNHHGALFPVEFPFHNTPERGAHYPYKFNGGQLYAKYRFYSNDGPNRHLRMAAYAEGAYVNTTHHESEPDIDKGDNSGLSAGIITTYLKNKWALSFSLGYLHPFAATGQSPDPISGLPNTPVKVAYGKALCYSLSFGCLLLPHHYRDYRQTNVNLYLELTGKVFGNARVTMFYQEDNEYILGHNRYPPALKSGWYIDASPGIQFIFNSNLRVDVGATFRTAGFSYASLYPVYNLTIQRYIYLRRKR